MARILPGGLSLRMCGPFPDAWPAGWHISFPKIWSSGRNCLMPLSQVPEGSVDGSGIWTGSLIERNGRFFFFYTGYATERSTSRPSAAPSAMILSPGPKTPTIRNSSRTSTWYEPADWRDPFVYWDEEKRTYTMLMAARELSGPIDRRGCIAVAYSDDLDAWTIRGAAVVAASGPRHGVSGNTSSWVTTGTLCSPATQEMRRRCTASQDHPRTPGRQDRWIRSMAPSFMPPSRRETANGASRSPGFRSEP